MDNIFWHAPARNSINQVIRFLRNHPFKTETEICEEVWGYCRATSYCSNKKYAELIRRGLDSRKILRGKVKFKNGNRSKFVYYLPETFFHKVG